MVYYILMEGLNNGLNNKKESERITYIPTARTESGCQDLGIPTLNDENRKLETHKVVETW